MFKLILSCSEKGLFVGANSYLLESTVFKKGLSIEEDKQEVTKLSSLDKRLKIIQSYLDPLTYSKFNLLLTLNA